METKLIRIDPRELKLLELNARYMRYEEFSRLVENVKRDGKLTSVPFGVLEPDGKYLVLSGNHRTQAAIQAGLDQIDIMVTDDHLDKEQRLAIQISHNAIAGQDDPAILKQLYESMESIDWKQYCGIDDATLELLENVQPFSIGEANLQYEMVSIVFLPDELEAAKAVLKSALDTVAGKNIFLARFKEYDRWLDSVDLAGRSAGVSNVATSLDIVLSVFEKNIQDLSEEWETRGKKGQWVPMNTIFGYSDMPVDVARVVKKALDMMTARKEVSRETLWKALEYWAADYIAGAMD